MLIAFLRRSNRGLTDWSVDLVEVEAAAVSAVVGIDVGALGVVKIRVGDSEIVVKCRPRFAAALAEPRPRHVRVVARLFVGVSDVRACVDGDVGVPFSRHRCATSEDTSQR